MAATCVDGECDTDDARTFVVVASFAAHSVTKAEALECLHCHVKEAEDGGYVGNPALLEYLTEAKVSTTRLNPDTNLLEGAEGIIPLPHDWIPESGEKGSLHMDFLYYLGNTEDPVTKNPEGDEWAFLKTGPDRSHTPLWIAAVGRADRGHDPLR